MIQFQFDRHTTVSTWGSSVSGLNVVHFKRDVPVLRAHIVVDTSPGNNLGCAKVLSSVYDRECVKYPRYKLKDVLKQYYCTKEEIVKPDSITYLVQGYTWESLRTGVEIVFRYILEFEPHDDEIVNKFLRNDYNTYNSENSMESFELDLGLYAEDLPPWKTRTSWYPFGLTTTDIKAYHSRTHSFKNMCLIVEGGFDTSELIMVAQQVEREFGQGIGKDEHLIHRSRRDTNNYPQPMSTIYPRLDQHSEYCWTFAILAKANNPIENLALCVLHRYFRTIIARDVANNCEDADWGFEDFLGSYLVFRILETLDRHLSTKVLNLLEEHSHPANFDLTIAKTIITTILDPGEVVVRDPYRHKVSKLYCIAKYDFLYGSRNIELWTNQVESAHELWTWKRDDWCNVINNFLLGKKSTTFYGVPSELKCVQQTVESLAELDIRNRYNYHLNSFDEKTTNIQYETASVTKIKFPETQSILSNALEIHFEDFADLASTIYLVVDTSKIDFELLKYISVLRDIFAMEEHALLDNMILWSGIDLGLEDELLELATLQIKFVPKYYKEAIALLQRLLYESEFDNNVIRDAVNAISRYPPVGVPGQGPEHNLFQERSVISQFSPQSLKAFRVEVLTELDSGNGSYVQNALRQLKLQMFDPKNLKVFVLGNIEYLDDPVAAWKEIFEDTGSQESESFTPTPTPTPTSHPFHFRDRSMNCLGKAYLEMNGSLLRTLGGTDLFNAQTYIPFEPSLCVKLKIAVNCLNYFQKEKSDLEYYKASFEYDLESHCLRFNLWEDGPDIFSRYEGFKYFLTHEMLTRCLKSRIDYFYYFVQNLLSELVADRITPQRSALHKIKNILRGSDKGYDDLFLKVLNTMTMEDIVHTVNEYFPRLFDPRTSFVRHTRAIFIDHLDYFTNLGYESVVE